MTNLRELLAQWLPEQRWFAAKGRQVRLLADTAVHLTEAEDVVVAVHLLDVEVDAGRRQTYQVPLVLRSAAADAGSDAASGSSQRPGFIGTVDGPDGGRWHVHDGPHDPAFVSALVAVVDGERDRPGPRLSLRGQRSTGAPAALSVTGSRVLSGEQSNTSIILDGPEPLICKVFRVVAPGDNPDVVVQSALTAMGSTAVPRVTGWVSGTWEEDGKPEYGHLAFVQEFLPGTRDAWRVALDAVSADQDFTAAAEGLGRATASVHLDLAAAFDRTPVDDARRDALVDGLLARLDWAAGQVPQLGPHADAARKALEEVRSVDRIPALQRVHGDYHLGQVLEGGERRGWVLLDFEGEPLRPLAERSAPDLALRDVAGMLRSFDYAAGHLVVNGPADDPVLAARARAWADSCRDAFCRGYAAASGRDPREDAVLLRALELDKALYEVVYESGNRPPWLPIPLAAVERLLAEPSAAGTSLPAVHSERQVSMPSPSPDVSPDGTPDGTPDAGTSGTSADVGGTPAPTTGTAADAGTEAGLPPATAKKAAAKKTGTKRATTKTAKATKSATKTPSKTTKTATKVAKTATQAATKAAGAAKTATKTAAQTATTAVSEAVGGAAGEPAPEIGGAAVTTPTLRPVPREELDRIVRGDHGDPHGVLGLHPYQGSLTLRTLRPHARRVVAVLPDGSQAELEHEHEGIFAGLVPGTQVTDYRLDVTYDGPDGTPESQTTHRFDDPYRFLPTIGEVDLHLIGEGRHEQLWQVLGAQVRRYPGVMGDVTGTSFAVWAPHARGIRLVGDMNHWDGTSNPMRALGSTGVWELFVPGVGPGTRYKFEITGADGHRRMKADPMARATEVPPSTASVVTDSAYEWRDQEWLAKRAATDPHQSPMTTYEVHLGSWREGLGYRELAEQLVDYVVETGFTHVELLPVMEHPYGPSWGYQVTGYYAPTSRFGSPDEFRHLVDALHAAGIGVILDWVPAHFPRDAFALARFDGQPLYEHPDPRRGDQPDWGTHIFDLGRPQVRNFLVANALYWCEEFHIDGLRVDAVASMLYLDYSRKDGEWLPNEYGGRENLQAVQLLQETNATIYRRVPGVVTIAEESTAWPGVTRPTHLGGLGFGLKWNMGWMHDSLEYIEHDPIHRQWHHHQMTFSLMYAWTENFILPISHDEVVYGKGSLLRKMPGDRWQQLANVRAYLTSMWAHPGKKLLFMGTEFAQEAEWAHGHSLDWWLLDQPWHRGVLNLVTDLNRQYRDLPALWSLDLSPDGFRWIDANDAAGNVFSWLRYGKPSPGEPQDVLACIVNFSPVPRHRYRIGLPSAGQWDEILNTDSERYGGSGVGNLGAVQAVDQEWHGLPASAEITLPPLGAVWFRPARAAVTEAGTSAADALE